jgi:lipoprotein-anchoring transpeptidase ErfK/SrfK
MNPQFTQAREHVLKAREALRRGDKTSARQWGEQAALLAPDMEDAWLILAASDPDPHEALAYARKALQLNPQSGRAHRAVEWAEGRLTQAAGTRPNAPVPPRVAPDQVDAIARLPEKQAYQTAVAVPQARPKARKWLLPALLTGGLCMLLGIVALFAITSPALASLVSGVSAPAPTQESLWAPVDIAKSEATSVEPGAVAIQAEATPTAVPTKVPATALPTDPPTVEPTEAPTEAPTQAPILEEPTPAGTEIPGGLVMEVVEEAAPDTSAYVPPQEQYPSSGNGERWIDVDLTNQRVYAYEGDVVVNSFIVSTGTWLTPTVTGSYKVYVKYRSASMSGPGYYLPDVPYIMYFYKGYGLHGTYWHNNFGTPMSHGCVNLRTDEAAWLFNWASVGTVVNVHY